MTDVRARYEFGDFVLDVGQQQLLHRDTGKAIPLMGKAFDTLVYLVEHGASRSTRTRCCRRYGVA